MRRAATSFTGMHEDYHQVTDEPSKIRFDELCRILDAMSELARDYADGAKKPAYVRPAWFLTPPDPSPSSAPPGAP